MMSVADQIKDRIKELNDKWDKEVIALWIGKVPPGAIDRRAEATHMALTMGGDAHLPLNAPSNCLSKFAVLGRASC